MEAKELIQDRSSLSNYMRNVCQNFPIYRIEPAEASISNTPLTQRGNWLINPPTEIKFFLSNVSLGNEQFIWGFLLPTLLVQFSFDPLRTKWYYPCTVYLFFWKICLFFHCCCCYGYVSSLVSFWQIHLYIIQRSRRNTVEEFIIIIFYFLDRTCWIKS